MPLQSSGAISLNDVQNEFGGSNPIGIDEYYSAASGIPSSGTISLNLFYGASSENWEIIMHTDGHKGSGNNTGGSTAFGNTGSSTFRSITADSTGAINRTDIGDGVGLYAAFFYKKNITKFALISGSGGQNNLQNPSSHGSYHVWDTFSADRDGYTDTGDESLYEIIKRLDTYNLNNSSWAGSAHDSTFNGASIRNFSSGTNGYSVSSANAYPNPPTMKTVPLNAQSGSFNHTFTSSGASGRFGPTQSQVNSAYSGTGVSVSINTQGIQLWTVPFTGTYEITAVGGRGGGWYGSGTNAYGGGGAYLKGTTSLSSGTVLAIIVGQGGSDMLQNGGAGGGGGASWVLVGSSYPWSGSSVIAIAGGGGGASSPIHVTGAYGSGGSTSQGSSTDTDGGNSGNYGNGGGAGFGSDGVGTGYLGGISPYNGSPVGGDHTYGGGATGYSVRFPVDGGFGGGGASSWHLAGGGGGWAGGDGADWSASSGGGGGSRHNLTGIYWGTSSHNSPHGGSNNHGYVTIKSVDPTAVPSKFVIWGVNTDSDNDTQVLAAYSGTLATGKGDSWRGNNPPETYWSYWGNDWHSSSSGQTISAGRQTDPGVPTGVNSWWSLHHGDVYLIAYGPRSVIPFNHTFTNAGASGRTGPTLSQIQNAYSPSWASDTSKLNMTTQGYQIWTVPKTATYEFKIRGARGGHTTSGRGGYSRYIIGRLALKSGDKLTLIVGQEGGVMMGNGNTNPNSESGGGGGGSFVVIHTAVDYSSTTLMLAAGGGGGGGTQGSHPSCAGNDVRSDNYSTYQIGTAYINNGYGGGIYSSNYNGGGGGGWNSDGYSRSANYDGQGGHSYSNGFTGGEGARYGHSSTPWFDGTGNGGFGGGGGAWNNSEHRPGGGGGYSGGEGASYEQLSNGGGGAGGNYINTTHVTSSSYGAQETSASNGSIFIQEIIIPPPLYSFTSFTFTNAGATGRTGPTLTQLQNSYSSASWASDTNNLDVTSTGIQLWTVPKTGSYRIEAWGAAGGETGSSSRGQKGNGARMRGDFSLTKGEIIRILVGQQPPNGTVGSGGGGGSFVVRSPYNTNASILVIAGGGGCWYWDAGSGGTTSTTGQNSLTATPPDHAMSGGSNGNGGDGASNGPTGTQGGAGGGGFFTAGGNLRYYSAIAGTGGHSFTSGGLGGEYTSSQNVNYYGDGGFGGGGASAYGPGGGGGYSGGGGDWSNGQGTDLNSGGGGGSYNNGSNQDNSGNVQYGHGKVTITAI